jgi:hypothetical protein
MNRETLLILVRHLLTACGSLLVSKGLLDDATLQAVIGGILALVGFFAFRRKTGAERAEQLQLFIVALLVLNATGCALQRVTESSVNPQSLAKDETTYLGVSWFNRAAVEGLTIGKRTGKESVTFTLDKGSTETQAEAIKAAGEALGAGIAAGVKRAAQP